LQVGAIEALLAQLSIRHGLTMLTTDQDFADIAQQENLTIWREQPATGGGVHDR
jgi:predicted nucleic acid-binding protein